MGYSYVLGTKQEENEEVPKKVHPMQFHKLPVKQIGCGSQHVVALVTASEDDLELPKLDLTLEGEHVEEPVAVTDKVEEEKKEEELEALSENSEI
jgi:hypothetical protein